MNRIVRPKPVQHDWSGLVLIPIEQFGEDEGETCYRDGCTGTMELDREPCYCGATRMPPCSACENAQFICDECGEGGEGRIF